MLSTGALVHPRMQGYSFAKKVTLGVSNPTVSKKGLGFFSKPRARKPIKVANKRNYMWGIKADHFSSTSASAGSDRKSRRGRMRRATRESQ